MRYCWRVDVVIVLESLLASYCCCRQAAINVDDARTERRASYRAMRRADEQAKVKEMRQCAEKAREAFLEAFSHEERRLIMANAYWSIAADLAEQQGSTSGVLDHANVAAGIATSKSSSTVQEHMSDWRNNGGWFTPLMWGKNVKLASMVGDVDTQ